ncbi:MAG TPA: dienelactone hydrolase family protein [Burkholderiales bacterium]|nr:dienelactone hydrolase family protein [Burkholderiales bacterium]
MTQSLEAVEIETAASPDASVIWLHGLGADGHDFEPVVPELRLAPMLRLRFVFPHAPVRPVTLNMGMRMRAWYDILQLGGGPEDEVGVRASQGMVEALIERERSRGVAARRIVLAGFSQGGAIALHTGLRHGQRLAGILALSTYLPLAGSLQAERSEANRDVPIFMAHGELDDIIPLTRAQQSRQALAAQGYALQWHSYPMPHSLCGEEIADIAAWLAANL